MTDKMMAFSGSHMFYSGDIVSKQLLLLGGRMKMQIPNYSRQDSNQ